MLSPHREHARRAIKLKLYWGAVELIRRHIPVYDGGRWAYDFHAARLTDGESFFRRPKIRGTSIGVRFL
jgi:hypothetical protein